VANATARVARALASAENQAAGREEVTMKRLVVLALFCLTATLHACRETSPGLVVGAGTISASNAECGAWFVRADSGRWYQLTHLDPAFQQGGLRVRFTLKMRTDMMSACMSGEIADVVSMRKV
jgi:hypothetical protein